MHNLWRSFINYHTPFAHNIPCFNFFPNRSSGEDCHEEYTSRHAQHLTRTETCDLHTYSTTNRITNETTWTRPKAPEPAQPKLSSQIPAAPTIKYKLSNPIVFFDVSDSLPFFMRRDGMINVRVAEVPHSRSSWICFPQATKRRKRSQEHTKQNCAWFIFHELSVWNQPGVAGFCVLHVPLIVFVNNKMICEVVHVCMCLFFVRVCVWKRIANHMLWNK